MKYFVFTISLISVLWFSKDYSPEELGNVNWLRNYEAAIEASKTSDKPILILFQEVPGCSTCRNYGHNVLSHPLMVEAIEEYFVPLAIYNNKSGEDAKILKKYGEPSWNNPVVRIIDSEGVNLTKRLASDYSAEGLYRKMNEVLEERGVEATPYFQLLGQELKAGNTETAYYKMFCFWSGEGHLGSVDGVVITEPGFMGGAEVVKVQYNPSIIKKEELDKIASAQNCSATSAKANYRVDKDPQYYLKKSEYRYLPLSQTQRTKINSALASGTNPEAFLSPTQKRWYSEIKMGKTPDRSLYDMPLTEAWQLMVES
ncbi:MAG: VPGUxxT family thioredoxin-like (seleno)protein, type 2 [Bacteroidota bacterium]